MQQTKGYGFLPHSADVLLIFCFISVYCFLF